MLVATGAEDEVDNVSETDRRDKEDDDDDTEPVERRPAAVGADVRCVSGPVVRAVDVDRKETGDDVAEEDGDTDQVQLDKVNVGVALGVLEREAEDREVRGVIVSQGCIVNDERLLHGEDVVCEVKSGGGMFSWTRAS